MTKNPKPIVVELVPVNQVTVANPRIRNKKIFQQIIDSISKVGLKKPITVSRSKNRRKNGIVRAMEGVQKSLVFRAPAFVFQCPSCHGGLGVFLNFVAGSWCDALS